MYLLLCDTVYRDYGKGRGKLEGEVVDKDLLVFKVGQDHNISFRYNSFTIRMYTFCMVQEIPLSSSGGSAL